MIMCRLSYEFFSVFIHAIDLAFAMIATGLVVLGIIAHKGTIDIHVKILTNLYAYNIFLLYELSAAMIFSTSVLGCVALCFGHKFVILIYSVSLILVTIPEGMVMVALIKTSGYGSQDVLVSDLHKSMDAYKNGDVDHIRSWQFLQNKYSCCGIYNASDWARVDMEYPSSCFTNKAMDILYNRGCLHIFASFIDTVSNASIVLFTLVVLFQISCVFFSCILMFTPPYFI